MGVNLIKKISETVKAISIKSDSNINVDKIEQYLSDISIINCSEKHYLLCMLSQQKSLQFLQKSIKTHVPRNLFYISNQLWKKSFGKDIKSWEQQMVKSSEQMNISVIELFRTLQTITEILFEN